MIVEDVLHQPDLALETDRPAAARRVIGYRNLHTIRVAAGSEHGCELIYYQASSRAGGGVRPCSES